MARNHTISLRCTQEEYERIKSRADSLNLKPAVFARMVCVQAQVMIESTIER